MTLQAVKRLWEIGNLTILRIKLMPLNARNAAIANNSAVFASAGDGKMVAARTLYENNWKTT
jgi:hypothetical protein